MPDAAWSTIFMLLVLGCNVCSVRLYGESEYYFSLIKVLMVLVFIIVWAIGFKYWSDPGAFANGGVGTVSVLLSAGYSFQGTEVVGITAGEASNPVKAVPRAIKNTFWRILVFYVLTILLIGMCIPYDNQDMANSDGSPSTSPFTLVFKLAGVDAGVHVVNAIVLVSVLSACNSSIYVTARILLGLAHDGNAPRSFTKTNRFGAPWVAVLVSSTFGFACCFVSIYSASVAFTWFVNITAITGYISWLFISVVHLRFRRAYVKQGRNVDDLPYKSALYPLPALFSAILCLLIILGQGYTAFTPSFDGVKFVGNYIGLLPFLICYIGHKLVRRKPWVAIEEIDFETGRVTHVDIERARASKKATPWYKRFLYLLT
ncbi:hypothetical protein DM01DRAFT_319626 [Hesseltinella vesiculosa]|uniref:Amino acid permease/ SLC12A domain-containing protein n=1 Tax=Hesseltinella vesiculosa TaxID=101127 RepID=A0A1X2GTC5_9FUNG|nr:hypothetical protein DM01DRAFT_319626 [Hesseltinella vesiculosa]